MTNIFGPSVDAGVTTVKPTLQSTGSMEDTFFKDCSAPGKNDGTDIKSNWLNLMLMNFREAVRGRGVAESETDDKMLLKAIQGYGSGTGGTGGGESSGDGNDSGETGSEPLTGIDVGKDLSGVLMWHIQDVKSPALGGGGTFSPGAWRTRDLNTTRYSREDIFSLSSNQFTLPEGDWLVHWIAPALNVGYHVSRLFNMTDSVSVAEGSTRYHNSGSTLYTDTQSNGLARLSLTASATFEIQHFTNTNAIGGYTEKGFGGAAAGVGNEAIFGEVIIYRG